MKRREFLATALLPLWAQAPGFEQPEIDNLKKYTINRVTGFRHIAPRPHPAGKNARRDVHGLETSEDILRIGTDVGAEGIGVGSSTPGEARQLLGHSLDEFWKP